MNPMAVCVKSRYKNIRGGYKCIQKKCQGRPVFHNQEKGTYIIYDGDQQQWVICDKDNDDEDYRFFEESASDPKSQSPLGVKWTEGTTLEIVIPENLKRADAPGNKYDDKAFPPCAQTLGQFDPKKRPELASAEWVRASNLQPCGEPIALYSSIEPSDILQGSLGDCWLMSACAGIAEFPDYVANNLIVEDHANKEGKYHIRIYDTQKEDWMSIEVDDAMPCKPKQWYENAATPLFCQPAGNEVYILLIEKAYAKYAGNYLALEGGFPSNAWVNMTGCLEQQFWKNNMDRSTWEAKIMNTTFRKKKPRNFTDLYTDRKQDKDRPYQKFWEYLQYCNDSRFLMGCSIRGKPGQEAEHKRADGLVEDHAYSLIQVLQVKGKKAGSVYHLLKIRNPWGSGQNWKGKFNDNDEQAWSLLPDNGAGIRSTENDGVFCIEYESFVQAFSDVYVSPCDMGVTQHKNSLC